MIAQGLQTALRQAGFAVDLMGDGAAAAAALKTSTFDVVLLDLGLPQRDGIQHRIAGLDAGADDYIVKPFDLDEMMARIRSVLRRASGRGEPSIQHGDLRMDLVSRTIERNGVPVSLSAHEFAVLEALLQRPGAVLSRT